MTALPETGSTPSLWIAGKWVDDRQPLEVIDKYHGDVIGAVAVATEGDIDDAVTSATRGGQQLARTPAHRRSAILFRAAELLAEQAEDFAQIIVREAGKPVQLARLEVQRAHDTLTTSAEEAKRIHGETVPLDAVSGGEHYLGFWRRRPVGVVAAVTPFNFPLNLVMHKVAPALAAGNSVVLKPAELTPLTAVKLCRLLLEAGLPEEAIQLVQGPGETIGRSVVRHPGTNMITFTGSAEVGRAITREAGLRRVTLELGNNSPVVVCEDADLDWVARRCAFGAFAFAGQMCISVQRVYADRRIYAALRERLIAQAEETAVGDPAREEVLVGPMIAERHADRIQQWIEQACAQGASVACGAHRDGPLHWPTVMCDVSPSDSLSCQEAFAPVVCLSSFETFAEGLHLAEETSYGLQAGVFTRDIDRALHSFDTLNFGGVVINDIPGVRFDHMPYGGNRESGLGREGVRFAIEEMTTLQMAIIRRNGETIA